MRKIVFICSILLLVPFAAPKAGAQEKTEKAPASTAAASTMSPEPEHFYRLDFVVEQLDVANKIINSRSYTTSVRTGPHQQYVSIRTSSAIPFAPVSNNNQGEKMVSPSQIEHFVLVADIDVVEVHEIGNRLAFNLTADIEGQTPSEDSTFHEPVKRENRWNAPVVVPIGKRTVVFASDSLDSKGSTRVVVTATPIEE